MPPLKRIRAYWVWVVFVFVALVLISFNAGKRRSWTPVEQVVIEITAPVQKFIRKSAETVERAWRKYFSFVDLREENSRLKKEADDLRMQNDLYRELAVELERTPRTAPFPKRMRLFGYATGPFGDALSASGQGFDEIMGYRRALGLNLRGRAPAQGTVQADHLRARDPAAQRGVRAQLKCAG